MKHTFLKAIIATVTAILFIAAISLGLFAFIEHRTSLAVLQQGGERLEMIEPIISTLEKDAASSSKWFTENTDNNLKMMQTALSDLISNGEYYGPWMFDDGMVLTVKDGQMIFPEEMPENFINIDGGLDLSKAAADSSLTPGTINEPGALPEEVVFSVAEIADGLYYLDWKPASDLEEYIAIHNKTKLTLSTAEKSIGGLLLVISTTQEGETAVPSLKYFSDALVISDFSEQNTDFLNLLSNNGKKINIAGKDYLAVSKKLTDLDEYLVLLVPYQLDLRDEFGRILLSFAMLVISITLIVYLTSVQNYIKKHHLTPEQKRLWHPTKVLKKVTAAGLICAIAIFAISAFVQTLSTIQYTTLKAQGVLTSLINTTQKSQTASSTAKPKTEEAANETADSNDAAQETADSNNSAAESAELSDNALALGLLTDTASERELSAQENEENWYVYYGKRIASLLQRYPELATKEKLQEFCDALQIDYIMLFDRDGNEYLCNLPYYGCSLGVGQGENGEDFKRLLNGVPSIVHPASKDETLGLTRQNIGVTLPAKDGSAPGALIMALLPERTQRTFEYEQGSSPLNYLFDTVLYFGADSETGEIKVSSLGGIFEGMNVSTFGLGKNTLIDGYMGFSVIRNYSCYLITKAQGPLVYYYIQDTSSMFTDVLPLAGLSTGGLIILYIILTAILFIGFTKKAFDYWAYLGEMPDKPQYSGPDIEEWTPEELSEDKKGKWKYMLPEQRTSTVCWIAFSMLLLLTLIYEAVMLLSKSENGPSLIQFITSGNWMRGFNLFAVCAIVLMVATTFLVVALLKWMLHFLPLILTKNGETISKLMNSVIYYAAILLNLYFALDYLGFNPAAIVASLGVVGLALSFGAKDMIADIFAGVTIIFENSFQVGDTVKIGNFRGIVENIGIRTTKIYSRPNGVKILNNKDIKDVINLSKYNARVSVEINVPAMQSLKRVREILERELPLIGEKNEKILDGPYYYGASELHGYAVKLRIGAECEGKNFMGVSNYLYEEIIEMMKREGIEMIRPLRPVQPIDPPAKE